MNNRDFFDEEFDRLNGQQDDQNVYNSWANYNYTRPPKTPQQKPFRIVFTAILMVVCIVLGWVLAVVTNDIKDGVTDGGGTTNGATEDTRKDILNEVFNYMDYQFYEEITDEEWQLAVEQAGSALMQYAGDQFSFLMSPQTYYDYMENVSNTSTAASNLSELFGMTYSMETKGMLVSGVVADSATYGHLTEGDMIVKLTNIKEYQPIDAQGNVLDWATDTLYADRYGNLAVKRYSNNTPVVANSKHYPDGFVMEGQTTSQVGWYLQFIYSATFHVLRDGEIFTVNLARNKVGINESTTTNKRYDFNFVEYYISDDVTNISTTAKNGAGASTYELRGLGNMPANTGYVRIVQFDEGGTTSCYTELKAVLELFKKSNLQYLVLDLKGNPGGYVNLTVNIAGMLIHPNNLTDGEKTLVKRGTNSLLITRLTNRDGENSDYSAKSTYYNYFPQEELANGKKRIIVWTDGNSASASELLTGTLLDYGTAVQMGARTYGKGIAQTIQALDITGTYTDVNGSTKTGPWAVYYTFANYYSPLGTNIHGVGYLPETAYTADNYTDLWTLARSYWGI